MSVAIDIKYAARLLAKKPRFTALTILIVAIGLGLTLYTYSLLNQLLFSDIKFADNKPVYIIEGTYDKTHLERREANAIDLYNLKNDTSMIDELGLYVEGTTFVGEPGGTLRKFNASYVSSNLFSFTGIKPMLGRSLLPSDHEDGAEEVLVIGYDMWQGYFNGEQDIVGKTVSIDGDDPAKIVGIMPQGFAFPAIADMWQPLDEEAIAPTKRNRRWVSSFVKLKDSISLNEARSVLKTTNLSIANSLDDNWRWLVDDGEYLTIEPMKKAHLLQYHGMFIALMFVVILILALACINVGNLLLSRVNERIKEVAVRIALGVPQQRLILQMLLESIFICSIGGILGLLLAGYGLDITNSVLRDIFKIDGYMPYWWSLAIDGSGIALLVATVILMIVVTGLIPATQSLRSDFNALLRDGTRGALSKRAARTTKVLVVSEIILSCVVLIMASIILISTYSASNADYGVETENRLTATLQLPPSEFEIRSDTEFEYEDRLRRSAFYYALKNELTRRDNIENAIFMTQLPGTGGGTSYFEIEGRAAEVFDENPYSNNEGISHGELNTLGMRVVDGRDFNFQDAEDGARSILVNESIARDFFPEGDAVGSRVRRASQAQENTNDWFTIVGVVSDTFHGSLMDISSAQYNTYHSMDNWGPWRMQIALHYVGHEQLARNTLIDAINTVNSNVGMYNLQSYNDLIKNPTLLIASVSKIFLICGIVAAFLAASGIYAVAANSVQQRTQEIGVRRALGAPDNLIVRMFIVQASWQLIVGVCAGIGISLWLISLMSSTMVFSLNTLIVAMVGMPLIIVFMVLLATLVPTKRVIEKEPAYALHYN